MRNPLSVIDRFRNNAWRSGMAVPERAARLGFLDCLADAFTFPDDLSLKTLKAGPEGLRADRDNIRRDFQNASERVLNTYKSNQDVHDRLCEVQNDHEQRINALTLLCMRVLSERPGKTTSP